MIFYMVLLKRLPIPLDHRRNDMLMVNYFLAKFPRDLAEENYKWNNTQKNLPERKLLKTIWEQAENMLDRKFTVITCTNSGKFVKIVSTMNIYI